MKLKNDPPDPHLKFSAGTFGDDQNFRDPPEVVENYCYASVKDQWPTKSFSRMISGPIFEPEMIPSQPEVVENY